MKTTIRRATRSAASIGGARNFVRRLTKNHGLRCILYHEIAAEPSEFTAGLQVTTSPDLLRDHLEMLALDYEFVSIDWLNAGSLATESGKPPLLVTFDDAYASVGSIAAEICEQAAVPSVFFVNGSFVDNAALAFDNLVAWVVNAVGMDPLTAAAGRDFADVSEFFRAYLSTIPLEDRARIFATLAELLPSPPADMAADGSLYISSETLASLGAKGMVVGNHTWSHAYCRSLTESSVEIEIENNKRFLESVVGHPVDAFSYPYGSYLDATASITADLDRLGHRTAFLVESRANRLDPDPMRLSRVSVGSVATADLFTDLEVLPVLRRARDRLQRN